MHPLAGVCMDPFLLHSKTQCARIEDEQEDENDA